MSVDAGKIFVVKIAGVETPTTSCSWEEEPRTGPDGFAIGPAGVAEIERLFAARYECSGTFALDPAGVAEIERLIRAMRSRLPRRAKKADSRCLRRRKTIRKKWRGSHVRWWCEARGIADLVLEGQLASVSGSER